MNFVTGSFHMYFCDEAAARAAARDVSGAGFVADIRDQRTDGWLIVARRRQPFPADEQHRYASRLRGLVKAHGGNLKHFVRESAASAKKATHDEQALSRELRRNA